ncbi:DUF1150 domain-containing protein [Acetobacter sp. AN02]|uniref:DUF1150 family protein n=1 Tax=Acetobacter sp. AN02 TaxID=2894186 RepID=UPI002434574A|nr:DUF1150 family protein [Acetobacter sp. AN02]MDG6095038.1 DUF1150 domain-containing protein [Acetobacter sp. AN02]
MRAGNAANVPNDQHSAPGGAVDIRNLSDEQFLALGLPTLVYIRRGVLEEGQEVFAIHAANGEVMGVADDTDTVISTLEENQMVPMTIH